MTNTKSNKLYHNVGSLGALSLTMDVTSYASGGEAIAASDLGIASEPILVLATPTEFNLSPRWDKANKKLVLSYPLAQHTHDLLVTGSQGAGDALQVLSAVVGKTGASNVTAVGGTSNVQNKTAAAGGQLAAADDGGTWEILVFYPAGA